MKAVWRMCEEEEEDVRNMRRLASARSDKSSQVKGDEQLT